jgi:hypothetical protein
MYRFRSAVLIFGAAAFLCAQTQVRVEPAHDSGQSVTAAYEGWFANPDGTINVLFGYFNRNVKQELEIPAGDGNKIEPGGPDQGQPTHFLPRRNWGVFTVTVPKDFGRKKLVWTLIANGATTSIPANLDPLWEIEPFKDATNNTPPFIGFDEKGPFVQGPRGHSKSISAGVGTATPITVWIADDANVIAGAVRPKTPAVTLAWSKFRGPGQVKFANDRPTIESADVTLTPKPAFSGKATTTATFSEPGEYILRVVANDYSGDGGRGFQCCWSNAQINVSVK